MCGFFILILYETELTLLLLLLLLRKRNVLMLLVLKYLPIGVKQPNCFSFCFEQNAYLQFTFSIASPHVQSAAFANVLLLFIVLLWLWIQININNDCLQKAQPNKDQKALLAFFEMKTNVYIYLTQWLKGRL